MSKPLSSDEFLSEYGARLKRIWVRDTKNPSAPTPIGLLLGYADLEGRIHYDTVSEHEYGERKLVKLIAEGKVADYRMTMLAPLEGTSPQSPNYTPPEQFYQVHFARMEAICGTAGDAAHRSQGRVPT